MITKLENMVDVEEMRRTSGHNFDVEMKKVFAENDNIEIPHYRAVCRKDNGKALSVVSERYQPYQPDEMWNFAEQFCKVSGGKIDRSMVLDGGARIGVSVFLGEKEYLKGDSISNNLLLWNTFDGSKPFLGRGLSKRFFCQNQFANSESYFSIRHTMSLLEKVDIARNMMNFFIEEQNKKDEQMSFLVKKNFSRQQAIEWFTELFPKSDAERAKTIMENRLISFGNRLDNGIGVEQIQGMKGTAYCAFNALTEYVNHEKTIRGSNGDREDKRFDSVVFGSGNTLIYKGLNTLLAA
jgi:phage/plasmid-like protein (TIGR03299 family)